MYECLRGEEHFIIHSQFTDEAAFDAHAELPHIAEVARRLRGNAVTLRHPLQIIDFLSEEPSDYGPSCIGSRAMTGFLDAGMLALCNPAGEPLAARGPFEPPTFETYTDMQYFLLLDPIHDVEAAGWPHERRAASGDGPD